MEIRKHNRFRNEIVINLMSRLQVEFFISYFHCKKYQNFNLRIQCIVLFAKNNFHFLNFEFH